MPIWLRKFTWNSINEYYEKEKAEYEAHMNKGKIDPGNPDKTPLPKINVPDFVSKVKSAKK